MPVRAIFERYSDSELRGVLREAKKQQRRIISADYTRALDFLEGRQLDHTQSEIDLRYPRTQSGGGGQGIEAVALPMTQRYVAEAANAYNRKVVRKLVTLDGETNERTEAMSLELNKKLDEIGYNEKLHRLEQLQALFRDVGLWFQVKAGLLRPVIVLPQDIYPVAPPLDDSFFMDPTDQSDYLGYVIEILHGQLEDDSLSMGNTSTFAAITPTDTSYYIAQRSEPYQPTGDITMFPNPFKWEQTIDNGAQGTTSELPLQMMTLWHQQIPVEGLLTFPDTDIVTANLELNVQWSMLLDTMRLQGWDVTVLGLLNPEEAGVQQLPNGSRFPIVVQQGETVTKIGSTAPYAAIVEALRGFIKTLAVAHRQSPNDFAVEGAVPQSGFAKLVDSLPKLEARDERLRRLRHTEENLAWPRIASIGEFLGWDGFTSQSVRNVKLRVEFADIKFPNTIDEDIKRWEFELKHGMTTPAEILAKSKGIGPEEAQAMIDENKAAGSGEEQEEPAGRQQGGGGLAALINQRRAGRGNDRSR